MAMDLREIAAAALDEWEDAVETEDADGGVPPIPGDAGGSPTANPTAAKLMFDLQQHDQQYHKGQPPTGSCKYRDKVMAEAKALGVAGQMKNTDGSDVDAKSIDDREVKASPEWQKYVTDRKAQDAAYEAKLQALGIAKPALNGVVTTEEQKKVMDEWRKEVDDRKAAYLKETLGDEEAHCVEQLADIIDAGGEKAEKALAVAQEILNRFPDEKDPRNIGAKRMIQRGEWKKRDEEYERRKAEQDAREEELKAREKELNERAKNPPPTEGGNGGPREIQVGRKTYVDLSDLGFWDGLKEAFKAGWNGKEIITEWDKMSGRWDKIREHMTKAQRKNYDGLSNGLAQYLQEQANNAAADMFEKYLGDESPLTDEQKAYVAQLYADWSRDDEQKTRKLKELNKYLAEQGIEQGGKKSESGYGTGGFSKVTTDATRDVPTTDILQPVPKFARDTTAQKQMMKDVENAFADPDVEIDIITDDDSLVDGPRRFSFEMEYDPAKVSPAAIKAAFDRKSKSLGIKDYKFEDVVEGKRNRVRITMKKSSHRPASFRALFEYEGKDEDDDRATAKQIEKMSLPMLIGETMDGAPIWGDFIDHGLLGGTTGSGKTTSLNSGIGSLFMARSPKQVRVLINDAAKKGQDLGKWNGDKHLLSDVATTEEDVVNNLKTMCDEIDRRAELLNGKSLSQYNAEMRAQGKEEMPFILGITDEMTDLFDDPKYGKDAAGLIAKIVRKGRSLGVAHLGATQRPSAKNTPKDTLGNNRVCLKMNTPEESNMVINGYRDGNSLQKHGDGMTNVNGELTSIQAPLIDDADIEAIRNYDWTGLSPAPAPDPSPDPSPDPAPAPVKPTPKPAASKPDPAPAAPTKDAMQDMIERKYGTYDVTDPVASFAREFSVTGDLSADEMRDHEARLRRIIAGTASERDLGWSKQYSDDIGRWMAYDPRAVSLYHKFNAGVDTSKNLARLKASVSDPKKLFESLTALNDDQKWKSVLGKFSDDEKTKVASMMADFDEDDWNSMLSSDVSTRPRVKAVEDIFKTKDVRPVIDDDGTVLVNKNYDPKAKGAWSGWTRGAQRHDDYTREDYTD